MSTADRLKAIKVAQQLAERIAGLERRLVGVERGSQLANSSLENTYLNVYDGDGNPAMQVGRQYDGTFAALSLSGPTPPTPSAPILQAVPGGVWVRWDGTFLYDVIVPMDFSRVELHLAATPVAPDGPRTLRSTFESPSGGAFFATTDPVTQYARLVTRSLSGKGSQPSPVATVKPYRSPASLVEWGIVVPNETNITEAIGLMELPVVVEVGRQYRIDVIVRYARTDQFTEFGGYILDGGPDRPLRTSPQVGYVEQASYGVPNFGTSTSWSRMWSPPTGGLHRLLVVGARGGAGALNFQAEVEMSVWDVGLGAPSRGVLNNGI